MGCYVCQVTVNLTGDALEEEILAATSLMDELMISGNLQQGMELAQNLLVLTSDMPKKEVEEVRYICMFLELERHV